MTVVQLGMMTGARLRLSVRTLLVHAPCLSCVLHGGSLAKGDNPVGERRQGVLGTLICARASLTQPVPCRPLTGYVGQCPLSRWRQQAGIPV